MFATPVDRVQILALSGFQGMGSLHQLRIAENGVERRAQLVAHVGQKLTLRLVGGIGSLYSGLKFIDELLPFNLNPVFFSDIPEKPNSFNIVFIDN
ncbi:MAG: hypothetical protein ACD_75C02620G0002 [uncultured bacterium]|nr:MAG: hypothetical protein ACD_75C02620G0002 [uncultured bacterium]